MIKIINTEQIIENSDAYNLNFDRYTLEQKSPLATKEIFITVDFQEYAQPIFSGEIIAYGQWTDLTLAECIPYLNVIICEHAMLRDFTKELQIELLHHLLDHHYLETLRTLLSYELQSGGTLMEGYTLDLVIKEFLSSDDVSLFDLKKYFS